MAQKPQFLFQFFDNFRKIKFFLLTSIFFLLAMCSFKSTFAACPSPNFIIGRGFQSGASNSGSVAGDFNNDGKIDVAVINSLGFNSVVAVTLGNGDGTFQAPMTTPMEPNGVRLATGDFNQDNKLDLAVALSSAGAVGIMLGNGNGTFGLTDLYTAQPGTSRLAIADFNGDSRLDIAASNFTVNSFSVFFGNANGSFGTATNYSVDGSIGGLASADFDQDGDNDLSVAHGDNDVSNTGTRLSYYRNNGAGIFSLVSQKTGLYTSRAEVKAEDITGDSVPDIVMGGSYLAGLPDQIARLYAFRTENSGGQTTFNDNGNRQWGISFSTTISDIALGDVNSDGQKDIVALNSYNGNLSVIITGNNGAFTPSINYYAGNSPLNVYLRDLNGDTKLDIIVTNSGDSKFNILLNIGNGRFSGAYSVSMVQASRDTNSGGGFHLANVNNDSFIDFFQYGGSHENSYHTAALGNSTGNFNGQGILNPTPDVANNRYAGTLGDFSGDGKPDYLHGWSDASTLRLMLGNGNGAFSSSGNSFQIPGIPTWVVSGDFNNDAKLDAVAAITTNQIAFLRGNGQGSFNSAVMTSVGTQPFYVVAADFNSDGNLDLATANYASNNVSVLLGNGNGTFVAATNYSVGTNPTHITVADLNADGKSDLVVPNSGANSVSALFGNGVGGFGTAMSITVGTFPHSTAVADFNNDGFVDIVTANRGSASNSISLNLGTGSGSFGAATHITYGMHEPLWIFAQDTNLDSRPDLIIAQRLSNQVNVLINSCEAFNLLRPTPFDYDGDGKTDISIFRPAQGEWWYQKSSNGGNFAAQFGSSTDKIVPADYTGDDKTDFAFFRPSTGQWFVLRSEDFSFYAFPFGNSTDTPVPADYDGDGKADAAVFRESSLTWFINKSSGGTDIIGFGSAGDKPVVGDYDGDGKADIAIYRNNGGVGEWWIRRSSNGSVFAAQFGASTDKAVQGDYTGDGKTDIAVWRPSNGNWFILRSEDFSFYAFPFGANGDMPVAGDYDGDGKTDAGVFRPTSQTWFINRSTSGTLIQQFGINGDLPTPNAFVP